MYHIISGLEKWDLLGCDTHARFIITSTIAVSSWALTERGAHSSYGQKIWFSRGSYRRRYTHKRIARRLLFQKCIIEITHLLQRSENPPLINMNTYYIKVESIM
jgi:hypothetical protein